MLLRKAGTVRRRIQAERTARLYARADPATIYGQAPHLLSRRHVPAWPSARAPRDFFARQFPDAAAYAVAEADQILSGRLRLFGELESVGAPPSRIDWDYRPTDERSVLFTSDPKFPWEVTRHAVFPRLGAAWSITRDERYPDFAAHLVLDWTSRYSEPVGLHWSSALEVGIRLIAWCQAFHFFRSSAAFRGAAVEALLRHVAAMAAWLDGHLSVDRVVAGNHLLGELAGLVVADLYFPELGERTRLGRNLVLFSAEVERQVSRDGVSREQSSTYGRFVADFVAAVLGAARATGVGVPPGLEARGAALAEWLAAMTQEDGTLPLIGDNDNGKGADWGEPGPSNDARGVILALATLLEVPGPLGPLPAREGKGLPKGAEVAFWWTGEEGLRRLSGLLREAPERKTVYHFSGGGHAVIRGGPERNGDFVHVRCGPFGHGLPKPSSHSHADWMAPVVTLCGVPVLVDPGNFGYTTAGPARDEFRSDLAHNLFRVGDRPLAVPGDAFRWTRIPAPGKLAIQEEGSEVRVSGRWSPAREPDDKPVACSRTLVYNNFQRVMSIEDEWSVDPASARAGVSWSWHFPPDTIVEVLTGGAGFETVLPGGARFVFELNPIAPVRVLDGWVSPAYSRRLKAPVVVVERAASNEAAGRQVTRLRRVFQPGEISA